jgi:hypothetical protein
MNIFPKPTRQRRHDCLVVSFENPQEKGWKKESPPTISHCFSILRSSIPGGRRQRRAGMAAPFVTFLLLETERWQTNCIRIGIGNYCTSFGNILHSQTWLDCYPFPSCTKYILVRVVAFANLPCASLVRCTDSSTGQVAHISHFLCTCRKPDNMSS